TGLPVQSILRIEHALIANAVMADEEVAVALPEGRSPAGEIPQLAEAAAQASETREPPQVPLREPVLARDPGPGLRRVQLLQPAVGIGDGDAVQMVDMVDP